MASSLPFIEALPNLMGHPELPASPDSPRRPPSDPVGNAYCTLVGIVEDPVLIRLVEADPDSPEFPHAVAAMHAFAQKFCFPQQRHSDWKKRIFKMKKSTPSPPPRTLSARPIIDGFVWFSGLLRFHRPETILTKHAQSIIARWLETCLVSACSDGVIGREIVLRVAASGEPLAGIFLAIAALDTMGSLSPSFFSIPDLATFESLWESTSVLANTTPSGVAFSNPLCQVSPAGALEQIHRQISQEESRPSSPPQITVSIAASAFSLADRGRSGISGKEPPEFVFIDVRTDIERSNDNRVIIQLEQRSHDDWWGEEEATIHGPVSAIRLRRCVWFDSDLNGDALDIFLKQLEFYRGKCVCLIGSGGGVVEAWLGENYFPYVCLLEGGFGGLRDLISQESPELVESVLICQRPEPVLIPLSAKASVETFLIAEDSFPHSSS
jgi:hypothetical protein